MGTSAATHRWMCPSSGSVVVQYVTAQYRCPASVSQRSEKHMLVRTNQQAHTRWALWLSWMLASVFTYTLVGIAFHFPSGFPPNNGESFNAFALFVGALQGAFTGLVIGSLQALILHRYFTGVRLWIYASVVSLAITHAIGDALPDSIALPIIQVIGGALLGTTQWFVLKNQALNAVVWILASAIAWFAGLTLGLAVMQQVGAGWQSGHIIVGLITGVTVAAITSALLVRLVSRSQQGAKA